MATGHVYEVERAQIEGVFGVAVSVHELLDGRVGVLRQVLHRLDQVVTQYRNLLVAVGQRLGDGKAAQVVAGQGAPFGGVAPSPAGGQAVVVVGV
ncbi:hypothetical protein [Streptomyces sp. NPDC095613]|uniref:hypothetical protein n=1 Tax=Streptomyces sp. NPDC095613 TaxID=3155540 RepID=UPI003327C7B6